MATSTVGAGGPTPGSGGSGSSTKEPENKPADPKSTGSADPKPRFTRLPYVPPKEKPITAQPTGKTPQTEWNAAALENRGVQPRAAFPSGIHQHHVLPQEAGLKAWFKGGGRNIDVDQFVVDLTQAEHEALHAMEGYRNKQWTAWIGQHQNATADEVWAFARQMMESQKIADRPPHAYVKGRQ